MKMLDALYRILVVVTAIAMLAAFGLIFFYAPIEQTMGIVQKIFYIHVPSAMAMYAGFVVTSVASVFYLLRPRRGWDIAAVTGVEVGLLFGVFVLISGPLWAYKAWGKAWTWDPQLTATFILFLMYGGYWLLRLFSGPSRRVRTIAAVLAVLSAVTIPFVHFAVRLWGGIHPTVERQGGEGLAPEIATAFGVSMLAFLLLFVCLLWGQIRVRLKQAKVDELYIDVKDILRSRA
jgi:heme exporter protein C